MWLIRWGRLRRAQRPRNPSAWRTREGHTVGIERIIILFQPLLYQVATAGLRPADIAAPIQKCARAAARTRALLLDEVVGHGSRREDGGAARKEGGRLRTTF